MTGNPHPTMIGLTLAFLSICGHIAVANGFITPNSVARNRNNGIDASPRTLIRFTRGVGIVSRHCGHNTSCDKHIARLRSAVDSTDTFTIADSDDKSLPLLDAVVCGGGPAGLLSAIMLARNFDYKVKVYERLPPPPSPTDESIWSDVAKFYLIGLGERGQDALREFCVWEDVEACCTTVPGRMDWAPDAGPDEGVERIFTDRPIMTQVLPRDKLVGVLHQHILSNYQGKIELLYQKEVTPLDFDYNDGSSVLLNVADCQTEFLRDIPSNVGAQNLASESLCDVETTETITTKLLIAADGTARTIAIEMEKADKAKRDSMGFFEKIKYGPSFHIKRYVDDNQRVYKTIPMKVPSKWRNDLNFSARSKDGRILFDSLPADANGNQCAVLLLKKDDEMAQPNSDPRALRKLFDDFLPQFSALLDDDMIATVAKKPPSFLPSFRYAAPRLNQGNSCVILGDSAHTVKPYFGLGANSALQDVQVLKRSIAGTPSIKDAVHQFSKERAAESKALVQISRNLDRPGALGLLTFVFPLIIDSIFNKMAPKIFSPNTISMLQKSENTFCGLRVRKRLERLGQLMTIVALFTGLKIGSSKLIECLSKLTGRRSTTVVATIVSGMAGIILLKKLAVFLIPGLAPADVLTKANVRSKGPAEEEATFHTITAYDDGEQDLSANMSGGGI
mmetsp:Transcript_6646/g.13631  ORF Transcript_6646/g.13631 Transcript_6646/m.13631 type:complete len:677 (-) Transcript_6646:72-2102(-)